MTRSIVLFVALVATCALAAEFMEPCNGGGDCDFPYVCRRSRAEDATEMCRNPAPDGAYCVRNVNCRSEGAVCVDEICVAPTGTTGSVCVGDTFCAYPLVCLGSAAQPANRTCAPRAGTGEYCAGPRHCAGSANCRGGVCIKADGRALDKCKRNSNCRKPNVCMKSYAGATEKSCRPSAATGEYCEIGTQCADKKDGCQDGICVAGAKRKGRGRRGKIILIVIVVLVLLFVLIGGAVLFRRIKRSPQAALGR